VICGITLFILALLLATPAVPAAVCLSKSEARQLWPKSHLYWYSRDRCWSNRRGPPRDLRMDPVFNSHAQAKKEPRLGGGVINTIPADQFNEIDAQADADTFFEAKPFELWRLVAVVDPYVFAELWAQRVDGQWPNK
jgi:hypothetical protein